MTPLAYLVLGYLAFWPLAWLHAYARAWWWGRTGMTALVFSVELEIRWEGIAAACARAGFEAGRGGES